MKKLCRAGVILIFTMLLNGILSQAQNTYNLNFEETDGQKPLNWVVYGSSNYKTTLDSVQVKEGKYAASIEFTEGTADFAAWAFNIKENFKGKKITLSGYIRTENVAEGYAGLWMRIDPGVAFDNMGRRGIKGTTEWTRYSITLPMNPDKTEKIVVGGLMTGKGRIWLDGLSVSIDGKDISKLKPYLSKRAQIEKETGFGKSSKVDSIVLTPVTVQHLKALGLVWGFLKYYHPAVASGAYLWDFELFRLMPAITAAPDNATRDSVLLEWINKLGPYKTSAPKPHSNVKLEPDLRWINSMNFSEALKAALLDIKNAKRGNKHYYIAFGKGVGTPVFKNEDTYATLTYPDAGIRMLALFRYWNIIQYFFPYKNLIEEDWLNVLDEFIPKMNDAKNDTAYVLTLLELIARVHDTHANIWGGNAVYYDYLGQRYAAPEIQFVENKAVVTGWHSDSLGAITGMQKGDIITAINKKPVDSIVVDLLKFTPASNYPTQLRDIASGLLRSRDSVIHVSYMRNNTVNDVALNTYTSQNMNIYSKYLIMDTCFKMLGEDIAYINNGSLQRRQVKKIMKSIKNTKGLIIDNRNYPSDFPVHVLSKYLMPGPTPFVKFTAGSLQTPGLFVFKKQLKAGRPFRKGYAGKVVILVNEVSQSSAEFHALAYRVHPRAVVIGSTTAGADGNVSAFILPGGIKTMISGIGVYYPDGRETQRVGIVPDIECKPTIEGIKAGRDEVLEKAVEIIKK